MTACERRKVLPRFSAAERRKSLATAEGRGFNFKEAISRGSGERFFRRSAADRSLQPKPRPSAVAKLLRRSAAQEAKCQV